MHKFESPVKDCSASLREQSAENSSTGLPSVAKFFKFAKGFWLIQTHFKPFYGGGGNGGGGVNILPLFVARFSFAAWI